MTESPRRNILLMNLSLFTGRAFFLPLPVFGTCSEQNGCQWTQQYKTRQGNGAFNGWDVVATTYLSPHLPDVLKNHVAMTIKCPHATKQLLVVPAVDKHLRQKRGYIIRTCNMENITYRLQSVQVQSPRDLLFPIFVTKQKKETSLLQFTS